MPASRKISTRWPARAPKSSHARSASARRRLRSVTGRAGFVLVHPGALVIAVDADGREIADPGEVRQRGDIGARSGAAPRRPPIGRDADEQVGGAGEQARHRG